MGHRGILGNLMRPQKWDWMMVGDRVKSDLMREWVEDGVKDQAED